MPSPEPETKEDPRVEEARKAAAEFIKSAREDAKALSKAGGDTKQLSDDINRLEKAVASFAPSQGYEPAKKDLALVEELWTSMRNGSNEALSKAVTEFEKQTASARDELNKQRDEFERLAGQNPRVSDEVLARQLNLWDGAKNRHSLLKNANEIAKAAQAVDAALSKSFAQRVAKDAQNIFKDNKGSLQPDGNGGLTHCDLFASLLHEKLYGETMTHFVPDQVDYFKKHPEIWDSTSVKNIEQAQLLADRGYLVYGVVEHLEKKERKDKWSHIFAFVRADVVPEEANRITYDPHAEKGTINKNRYGDNAKATFQQDHNAQPKLATIAQSGNSVGITHIGWGVTPADMEHLTYYVRKKRD